MRFRFIAYFLFFTLLLLFYPGNSLYFHIFAYNKNLFQKNKEYSLPVVKPVPYTKTSLRPEISAEGSYIVDLPSFTPVYEKNARQTFYPASTAKIITALVSLDMYKPEDIITVKDPLVEGQIMGLVEGERITLQNLLYGMLIHSGNDAAFAIANYYGYEQFVNRMNEKAKSIGMTSSHFKNPAGLDDSEQYTSPYDLALASRELLNNKMLQTVVGIKEITISDVDFQYFHQLSNVNRLLGEIQGIGGLKTGYTENAGENLVSFYKHKNHQFIIVIMKSQDRFEDTKTIVNWINTNVEYISL